MTDYRHDYGPWALIAGASEGTGAAFARQLAAKGIHLLLVARRAEPLESLATEIVAAHRVECRTAAIDLASTTATQDLAEAADGLEVGLLIFNAGADSNGSTFLDNMAENWAGLAQRNVMTVVTAVHHFAGPMRVRGRGGIILVGSAACYGGAAGIAVYSATKAFNLALGEGLWAELRPYGVDVLNLIMGSTDTPAHRVLMTDLGMAVPDNLASADDVATLGLDRLPHGPVCNWGLADGEDGYAGLSAAMRRQRVEQGSQYSISYTRQGRV